MSEIWKTTHIDENYEVSNYGRVRSIDRSAPNPRNPNFTVFYKGKILAQGNVKGYLCINLGRNNTTQRVSRLVAIAFLPNPHNLSDVNHKDGNKLNNTVENLEWCTRLENMQHARNTGLLKNHPPGMNSRLSQLEVDTIRLWKLAGYRNRDIALAYDLDQSTISKICSGARW